MCYDDRYLKTALVAGMATELGLFPHAFTYVRLIIENPLTNHSNSSTATATSAWENDGLYLLMDDPTTSIERSRARSAAIVRRRNDAVRLTSPQKGTPDIKRPKSEDSWPASTVSLVEQATRARYDQIGFIAAMCGDSGISGDHGPIGVHHDGCYAALDKLVDVEQYLRWLALMTLVRSGDYVDEVWFFASEELMGVIPWRFGMHAWDPDDSFQDCHHGGANALKDPHGLLYCAEGDFDKVLLRSPEMYTAFVDALEWVLREGMTAETVSTIADKQLLDMWRVLSDDDTAGGLLELHRANPRAVKMAEARRDIRGSMAYYLFLLEENRRVLLRRIAAYRQQHGNYVEDRRREDTNGRDDGDVEGGRGQGRSGPHHVAYPTTILAHTVEWNVGNSTNPHGMSSSIRRRRADLEATLELHENEYDARGSQELIVSDLRITNHGPHPVTLRGPCDEDHQCEGEGVIVTLNISFNPAVVYKSSSYVAPPSEFRLECWVGIWDAGKDDEGDEVDVLGPGGASSSSCLVPATLSMPSPESPGPGWALSGSKVKGIEGDGAGIVRSHDGAGGGFDFVADLRVHAWISNRSVVLRFSKEKAPGQSTSPPSPVSGVVELCVNCTLSVGKISFHHKHWLAFERGIVELNPVDKPALELTHEWGGIESAQVHAGRGSIFTEAFGALLSGKGSTAGR